MKAENMLEYFNYLYEDIEKDINECTDESNKNVLIGKKLLLQELNLFLEDKPR